MSVKIEGYEQLRAALKAYGNKAAKAACRKAIRAGTAIVLREVKAATPVDEGVLRKLQDAKVSVNAFRSAGIVGANVEKLIEAHRQNPARPTNIDWLVENGHVMPDGRFVPPSGYMRRAAAAALPAAEAKVIQVMRDSLEALSTDDE